MKKRASLNSEITKGADRLLLCSMEIEASIASMTG